MGKGEKGLKRNIVKAKIISRLISIVITLIMLFSVFEGLFVNAYASVGYSLDIDTGYISFGSVSKGDSVNYQSVTLHNTGSDSIHIIWNTSDPDGMLMVDAPNIAEIEPDDYLTFFLTVNTSIGAGSHYASIYFADASDPSYIYGACVDTSVTIREEAPYVTSVSVTPGNISATKNSSVRFSANVSGGNGYNNAVSWSVEGQKGSTSINSSGVLSIGQNETASSITVKATSRQDGSIYGVATVNITNDKYTVSVAANPSNGGAVTGGGTVTQNGSVTLTASPYSGYQFVRWTQNGIEIGKNLQLTINNINENKKIEAVFSKVNCTVHVTSNHSYGGTVSGDVKVSAGSDVTITATPNPGYNFDGWYENNQKVSSEKSYKITSVNSDRTFTAVFNPNNYTVDAQINIPSSGTVTGLGKYNQGSTVTLKANPASGYTFAGWFLNGSEYSKNAQISINNISANYSFVAYFVKQGETAYTITSSVASKDGTISPEGNFSVPKGTSVTYNIAPKAGYAVSDVKVDNISVGAVSTYTFTNVNTAHTITASFKKVETPTENHSVTPNSGNTTNNVTNNTPASNSNNSNAQNQNDYSRDVHDYNLDGETGLMQKYNLSDQQALDMIHSGEGSYMFEESLADGTFQISVVNELGNDVGLVQSIENADISIINIKDVVRELLTDEDLLTILHSENVILAFNILDNDMDVTEAEKANMKNVLLDGMDIGKYFQIAVLKTVKGNTIKVNELDTAMTLRINIPELLKADGRSYYIVRTYPDAMGNPMTDFLYDEDTNPDTITFTTDKFSSYAIAYTTPLQDKEAATINAETQKSSPVRTVLFFVVAGAILAVLVGVTHKFLKK